MADLANASEQAIGEVYIVGVDLNVDQQVAFAWMELYASEALPYRTRVGKCSSKVVGSPNAALRGAWSL